MQSGACQWRPEDVATQPLQPITGAPPNHHGGMKVVAVRLAAEPRKPEPAGDDVIHHAKESGVDLIVMATRGNAGIRRMVLGSVTDAVIRGAPCPVVVVPPDAQER